MRHLLLILLLAAVLAVPPMIAGAAAPRAGDGPLLVLHPPWVDGPAAVARAGGRVVGPVQARLATQADARDPSAFRAALRGQGAVALRASGLLVAICGGSGAGPASASPEPDTNGTP